MESKVNSQIHNLIPFVDKDVDIRPIPRDDLLYVEPELVEDSTTKTGIFLKAPKKQGVPNKGTILMAGKNISKYLKPGVKVVFKDPNARGFWARGVAHIPLKEEQIIATISEAKE